MLQPWGAAALGRRSLGALQPWGAAALGRSSLGVRARVGHERSFLAVVHALECTTGGRRAYRTDPTAGPGVGVSPVDTTSQGLQRSRFYPKLPNLKVLQAGLEPRVLKALTLFS